MEDNFELSSLTVKPRKRINSKTKGSSFERQVCDKLNYRFKTKDFCRTPGSGAFGTTHTLPEHLKIYGDLITPKDFNFTLELKAGYNKENLSSIFKLTSDFWGFWGQITRDSAKSGHQPMVIFKQNNRDIICVLEVTSYRSQSFQRLDRIELTVNLVSLFIIKLEDLLKMDNKFFFDQIKIK